MVIMLRDGGIAPAQAEGGAFMLRGGVDLPLLSSSSRSSAPATAPDGPSLP